MVRERFATGKNYHPFIVSNTRTLADQDMLQFALRSLFLASKTGYRYENAAPPTNWRIPAEASPWVGNLILTTDAKIGKGNYLWCHCY
jgi:hypothetical protein